MNNNDATEQAYKNGYADGYEDGKPKWISVEERLPDPYVPVIASRRGFKSGVRTCGMEYVTLENKWINNDFAWCSEVTHWMPLPEPPKGE